MEVQNVIKVETNQGRHEMNILGPKMSSADKGVMFYDIRIHFNEKDIKDIQNHRWLIDMINNKLEGLSVSEPVESGPKPNNDFGPDGIPF